VVNYKKKGEVLLDNNYLVKKSNYFIMNSSYDLSLEEQKIILTLASMVNPEDEEFKSYKFKISDFLVLLGIKDQSKYTEVPKITKELMKKVFEIQEGNTLIQTAWLSGAKYEKGTGMVELTFSSYLKPYMLKLNELFTRYRLVNILNMKSKYSIRIYELLKSNEFKEQKFLEIEIQELRKLLKADNIYPRYYDFKNKILKVTQKELAKVSDIAFDFEEIRYSREVKSIKFFIRANKPQNNNHKEVLTNIESKNTSEKESPLESNLEPLRAIMDKSITNLEIRKIYDAGNGDLEKIIKIYYYAKGKDVNNLVGYVIGILKNGFSEPKKNVPKSKKDFEERDYDYDDLEKKLLGWDK